MNKKYSFYVEDYLTELKQHLNLSEHAWLMIDEDIKNFYDARQKESFSGFLNRVFKNFYQRAEASVNLRALEKAEELERLYASKEFSAFDKGTTKQFIEGYTRFYQSELKEKSRAYPNGHGEKFRINKENLEILRELEEADNYDGSIGLYLKALFEEYVTKPSYLREQIFFNETLHKINTAISRQVKVKLTLTEKLNEKGDGTYVRKYYLSPYRIVQDKTNTFNYVIGYSEEIIECVEKAEDGKTRKTSYSRQITPACFRLSRIGKCDIQVSMGAKISKERALELEKMLVERGAMYLSGKPIEIKIKFTQKGVESFKAQRYMRPQFYTIDKEDKLLYTFYCTELQAINYFFKFGWDALIIEPTALSQTFKIRYERALKTYNGMTKSQILASEEE